MHQSSSDIFNSPERCSAGGSGRGRSRWGVFSVVLGVLGIAVGWVPFIGFVGIVFGVIGLVLAIRAISRKGGTSGPERDGGGLERPCGHPRRRLALRARLLSHPGDFVPRWRRFEAVPGAEGGSIRPGHQH